MCPQMRRFLAGVVTLLALFAATPAHAATKGPTRGEKAVSKALRTAVTKKRIKRSSYNRYRKLYRSARRTRKRLKGRRGRELGSVISSVDRLALRRKLIGSRMPALFLILQRNTQYWPRKPSPPTATA